MADPERAGSSEPEPEPERASAAGPRDAPDDAVYVTSGLLAVLLEFAADADPGEVTVALAATAAGDIEGVALPPETPVFTDFYLPDAGDSIEAVFGMDLSVSPGQTHGRFVSHPAGDLRVSQTDEFHAVMLVAVPPWEVDAVAAFGRDGTRRSLTVLDAVPPERRLERE